jgi:hypothetical protein
MVAGGVSLFIVSIELLTYGVWRFGVGTVGRNGKDNNGNKTSL